MFIKKPDKPAREPERPAAQPVATPAPAAQAPAPSTAARPAAIKTNQSLKGASSMSPSIIGNDLTVMGNVVSKGEVQVDGEIQGDIHCASLLVGDNAQITGGIVAEDVVVRGRVQGSIRGVRVTLQSSSHVEGDIFHQSLAIEQGAFFEGKSRRADDPISSVPRPDSATSSVAKLKDGASSAAVTGTN